MEANTARCNEEAVLSAVRAAIGRVTIGPVKHFSGLTIFPLLAEVGPEPDYLTLDEALRSGLLQVTEVSEGGSVPNVKVVNESRRRVLLLDGEELVGAKQNRVLNLTILVPAGGSLVVPVSCVEARRWHARSREFSASDSTLFARSRAKKQAQVTQMMFLCQTRQSDQSEVWSDIAEKALALRASSPTDAMADVFEEHRATLREYVDTFGPRPGQVGILCGVHGKVAGCDLFEHPTVLAKLLPKLVRSYALDAMEAGPKDRALPEKTAKAFLAAALEASGQCFPAVGEGVEVRLTAEQLTGAALVADGRVVHVSLFPHLGESERERQRSGRVRRASSRRLRRTSPDETPPPQE